MTYVSDRSYSPIGTDGTIARVRLMQSESTLLANGAPQRRGCQGLARLGAL